MYRALHVKTRPRHGSSPRDGLRLYTGTRSKERLGPRRRRRLGRNRGRLVSRVRSLFLAKGKRIMTDLGSRLQRPLTKEQRKKEVGDGRARKKVKKGRTFGPKLRDPTPEKF